MPNTSILAIIPARGGSKGLPDKNARLLAGKPLVAWSIEAALQSQYITKTVVSSDSDVLLDIATQFGAETLKRPAALAQDHSRTEPVIDHVLNELESQDLQFDYIVLLQPTSPLRTAADIDAAMETLRNSKANALISVMPLQQQPLKAFTRTKDGFLKGLVNNDYPFMPRQALPEALLPNGALYIIETLAFKATQRLVTPTTIPFVMPEEKSLDIDSETDLNRAEAYLKSMM